MTNRITGTNSGIDVDSVVKQSLTTQQNKIDKAYQQQKVYEYQQSQLKEIVEDVQKFYDKYLDILSGDSLLKSSAYETVSFTTTDSSGKVSQAVTAKGFAGADVSEYKVTVTQLAQKASATLESKDVVSGNKVAIKMGDKIAAVDVKISDGKVDMTETAKALNTELKKQGINATAKYSEFAKGIVIESGEMGKEVAFELSTNYDPASGAENKYTSYSGKNAEGTIVKGEQIYSIDKSSNVFTVDNIQFTLNSITTSESTSSNHLTALTSNGNITTITSKDKTTVIDGDTTMVTSGNTVTKLVANEDGTVTKTTTVNEDGVKVEISGDKENPKVTVLSGSLSANMEADSYPTEPDNGVITNKDSSGVITATKDLGNGITITTTFTPKAGKNGEYDEVTIAKVDYDKFKHLDAQNITDTNVDISIESADGNKKTTKSADGIEVTTEIQKDGSILTTTRKTLSNGTVSVESVENSGAVMLNGETDISGLKDTIVGFVNDYNKVMESINEKLWETRDKNYMPLTDEQKKEMSDTEIEAWEKKAQTGLLKNDSDLRRIQSAMKSAMSSMMSSTGLTLESIGIEPVDNYTTKNGMYKIDEDKLTKALQNNAEEVKDLFTRSSSTYKDEKGKEITDKGGVLTQLQSVLKSEFKSSTSSLSKRIGFDGTSTEKNNTLTNNISKQKTLASKLKSQYKDKETALYKKYSSLEVMLQKLNAQTNSLYSMLGIS